MGWIVVLALAAIAFAALQVAGARAKRASDTLQAAAKVEAEQPVLPLGRAAIALQQRIREAEQTALRLVPIVGPAASKLGGAPATEPDFTWPRNAAGAHFDFVAQIDLAQARSSGGPDWLPDQGRLLFFYDLDFAHGADYESGYSGALVAYTAAPPSAVARAPADNLYPERWIEMRREPSHPSPAWLLDHVWDNGLTDDELKRLGAGPSEPFGHVSWHQLGGYPVPIQQQGRLALDCEIAAVRSGRLAREGSAKTQSLAAQSWKLLLQLDSDEDMMWGDEGRIYFFIREVDARAGDFSRVEVQLESH